MHGVSTRCTAVPSAHAGGEKILDGTLVCILSRAGMHSYFFRPAFSFADVDTYVIFHVIGV